MKIRILLSAMAICLLCNCGIARAQNSGAGSKPLTAPDNTLFLELGPASNGIGVGYERRLLKSAQLYLRTGLGFGFSTDDALYQSAGSNNWSQGDCHTYSYTVPVGATYLLWDHRSKLELGAGAAFTYQHSSVEGYNKDDSFANLYGNVGWRPQRFSASHGSLAHLQPEQGQCVEQRRYHRQSRQTLRPGLLPRPRLGLLKRRPAISGKGAGGEHSRIASAAVPILCKRRRFGTKRREFAFSLSPGHCFSKAFVNLHLISGACRGRDLRNVTYKPDEYDKGNRS